MNKKLFCCLLALAAVLSLVFVVAPNVQASTESPVCAMSAEGLVAGFDSVDAALTGATENVTYYQLNADVSGGTISRDILLDLNGWDLSGVTIGEGVTVRLMDSANDGYDAALCGQLSGTVNGTVETLVKTAVEETGAVKSYVVVSQDGTYSAHRYYAAITDISLEPAKAALGYKSQFKGDATVQAMVTGFGYELWANDYPARQFTKTGDLQDLTLRLQNILVQGSDLINQLGSTATIGGRAVMTLDVNGQLLTVSSTEQETSLKQVIEAINAALGTDRSVYTTTQVEAVRALCTTYADYMIGWATEHIFADGTVDKFVSALPENDFIFRVGNGNAVGIDRLFSVIEGANVGTVTITAESAVDGVEASCTYDADTVQFSGTGPVTVTISDDRAATPFSVLVEVVDGYNVTAYKELGNRNSVLMNDITMSSGGTFSMTGATLYGNGFTFDVSDGAYTGTGKLSSNYLFYLNNANLDNLQLVGAVYTQYGAQVKDDYNRALVLSVGNNTITNSYISNCATPVRVNGGHLEIVNSTLKGGNFANLDIRNGYVVLDNVTTVNQVGANDLGADGTVSVGLGVVVYYENVLKTTMVEVRNGITQYNYLSKSQSETYITNEYAMELTAEMFDSDYATLQFNDGTDTWVNTGILSMIGTVSDANISDVEGYLESYVSLMGYDGYIHTILPTAEAIQAQVPEYVTYGQGAIAPKYSFDYTDKNFVEKTADSNDYCYEENGVIYISMDAGDTFNWDPAILTVSKLGQALDYTVSMDGVDYTGKTIPFNTKGDYTVSYQYTDPDNYQLGENGEMVTYSKTYSKQLVLNVSVVDADAKKAEFTFGSGQATEKIIVGNNTYISAAGVTDDNTSWSYITVDGTRIYYPIVEARFNSGKSVAYFDVFSNVVSITDYETETGNAVTYDASTTVLPDGLKVVKGKYGAFADLSSGWSGLNDSSLTQKGASQVFKYAASSSAAEDPTVESNVLCYKSPNVPTNRDEYYTMVQYSYTEASGGTYYYYVGYHMAANSGGCVTGDTLVTLADGSQKQIMDVSYTDQLMVWDFFKGEYAAVPAAIIFDHGYGNNTVIELQFSDGATVKVVNLHQFMDADLKKFVTIDAETVQQYVGHEFVKQDGQGYKTVTLESYTVSQEYVEAYGIISACHYNIMVNGMLSTDFMREDYDLFNYFAIGDGLMFDQEAMEADIGAYGLYTYEDFAQYLTYEQFVAFNVQYFKIAVGKGLYTYEGILNLIHTYLGQ